MRGVKRTPIGRTCPHCGAGFSVPPHRLAQGRGRFCSRACLYLSQVKAAMRDCLWCAAPFEVRAFRLAEGNGKYCSRPCWAAANRGTRRTRRSPARDGDAVQARASISRAIARGSLPRPNTVPCVDCGQVWAPGLGRHEYDHHLGYGAEHHESVEVVCRRCHDRRTRERVAHLNFIRGWLACLQWMKIAESWERWGTREGGELVDAF